jgi:ubiquinone/menaquinone biosynthesis C-methylase UbiE
VYFGIATELVIGQNNSWHLLRCNNCTSIFLLMMDRKTYTKDVYSKYWLNAREKKYGFLTYDRNLCDLICDLFPEKKGKKLLEAAIGTGYPFADFFQKKGFLVYGIDISPRLIEKCNKLYPRIDAKVGDVEDLEFPDNYFDLTYCFHSTWLFPDLNKAIDEMLRVTKENGAILFDIQNRCNEEIERAYKKLVKGTIGIGRVKTYAKNIAKIVLRKGTPDWHFVIHQVPTHPEDVCNYLKECNITNTFQILARKEDETLEKTTGGSLLEQYDRLIFFITKN